MLTHIMLGLILAQFSSGSDFEQILKLDANDGQPGDRFGHAVSIDGSLAAVGARSDFNPNGKAGSAYVFDLVNGVQVRKFIASDGATGDDFGWSVSMCDGLLAVGALRHDDGGTDAGAVYLYDVPSGQLQEFAKLAPDDQTSGQNFGASVLVTADAVYVGAPGDQSDKGAVYVFDRTGRQIDKIVADGGVERDFLGHSLAVSSDLIITGAPGNDDFGLNTGYVYVFDRRTGAQLGGLISDDAFSSANFGRSLALSGTTAYVGAPRSAHLGISPGAVYVFDCLELTQLDKWVASDGIKGVTDRFGQSVAMFGEIVIIGAPKANAAYIFDTDGNQVTKLFPQFGFPDDDFGEAVAIGPGRAIIGGDRHAEDRGSAFVFSTPQDCPPDINGDGLLNVLDFVAFQLAWIDGLDIADCDGDGAFDVLDFVCYQQAFNAGCEG